MENFLSMPLLSEVDTEEGKIISEMVQLLNYICVAPTLNRQELATKFLGVATKCMDTLNNQKIKIQELEKLHIEVNEQPEDPSEGLWQEEEDWEDSEPKDCDQTEECQEDRLLRDLKDSPTGQTILSPTSEYTVEATLGSGVFGVVAQCVKKPANETVALKVIRDSSCIEEAKEEVEILEWLKSLGSERFNIVSSKDCFVFNGHLCIEFQKLDVSLLDYIQAQGSLELKDIRPVLQQLTSGVRFLKDAGVVHGDLKPDNIMLVDRDQQPLKVQIIDFGVAMCNPEDCAGESFGTLEYRSPEILLGVPSNSPIDVWALGCIAGEMFMGTKLFDVTDERELMHRIVSVISQPPNEVLDRGLSSYYYFDESSSQATQDWVLKPLNETSPETSEIHHKKLHDLLKAPVAVHTKEDQALECDRLAFIDLMEKILCTDTLERISPEKILSHPFLTLSHLNDEKHSNYLKSSIERMKVCNNWSYDGGEHAEQSISSKTSNTSDWEFNTSGWEVNVSCASSSPEQNEETYCTTPDCCSPVTENPNLTRNTRRPSLIDGLKRMKAVITKKIRKLMS